MTNMQLSADLRLAPPTSGSATSADLIAFATYCAEHIARDLRGIARWELFLASSMDGQTDAIIRAHVGADAIANAVEARASACDPAVAIWEAMCDLEQPLRFAVSRLRAAS